MSRLELILSGVLLFSVILNIGLIVYVKGAIVRLLTISEELGDLQHMVNSFAKHIKSVYELEMFYGDETLSYLLDHAVSFNEQLETFEYIYSLTEAEEEEEEEEETQQENQLDDDTENTDVEEA
jgi:spore cortex formation protein SpoVR/YcgB (stage V sporulation)